MNQPPANQRALGVCYYPEQWPEERWPEDARQMAALGLRWVRIGEFAWSRLEPSPGQYDFEWLARALDVLHEAGLSAVLGTPTAAPPRWLVERMPDMLALDEHGRARGFGSRRHYCFSHQGYRKECTRIVRAVAERFGRHPGVAAWQTDNEYGCHGTTVSYSAAALAGFRRWLQERYGSVDRLNTAWGTVFWSQEYASFDEIELPVSTVTEANPAHRLDFRRYSSRQVEIFNALQVELIRELSPERPLIHNYMGRSTDFDHYAVGASLDIASWDSYPLGFLEWLAPPKARHATYVRQGDPDFQAFHHDLYRAVGRGRWWVMEQQPGPVNWAPHNPAPLPGMVRLWAWEAFAHGAEVVSWFRWRQAPFAQEQMHAGLLRRDAVPDIAFEEAAQVLADMQALSPVDPVIARTGTGPARVALMFDYESDWAWRVQPHGSEFSYFRLVLEAYRSLRRAGLSVDIVAPNTESVDRYDLLLLPALFAWTPGLLDALRRFEGCVCIGPRSGSKTNDFQIPESLPPDLPPELMEVRVTRVESLPAHVPVALEVADGAAFVGWREFATSNARSVWRTRDGRPALLARERFYYLCGWPNEAGWTALVRELAAAAGIETVTMPRGLRRRDAAGLRFYFNYGNETVDVGTVEPAAGATLDGPVLAPAGVCAVPIDG